MKVEPKLQKALFYGRDWAKTYKKTGSVRYIDMVHGQRRLAAIMHQEIHLLQQGVDAFQYARQRRELVLDGYCVNKREFRRLYGF
ncbi:hypothetical protein QCA50_004674 [Cerrena zonata]|uniref:Uncharacterized protein n=1 Tax=Cerrena zonata TaxID=2478898 RepID=A0AAW0GD39_9APHY